jgi:hypothetical protein
MTIHSLLVTPYKIPAIFLRWAFANQKIYFMFSMMAGSILSAGMPWLLIANLSWDSPARRGRFCFCNSLSVSL